MKNEKRRKGEYGRLERRLFFRLCAWLALLALLAFLFYRFVWYGRGSEWVLSLLQNTFMLSYETAFSAYHFIFRRNASVILLILAVLLILFLFRRAFSWFTRYFHEIDHGLDALTGDSPDALSLSPEMAAMEQRLRVVQQTLHKRELEAQLAEQRKNDLVTYLAHDIRTPLTSVIGYLSLLDEAPDMPAPQRGKYVHITLDKARRLEKLVGEFFEITRYNLQEITLERETIDLYYMLVQLAEEFAPMTVAGDNQVTVCADESLSVYADPGKLARVLNNLIRNAIAYSDPGTPIALSAERKEDAVRITVRNQGPTIPRERLEDIFEKFYRLDEARATRTGGAGLGLAIAKEIIAMHGGGIEALSEDGATSFTVTLPGQ